MEAQRSQLAVKLLPSLTDFAFLMPIAFLFGRMEGVKTLLSDCDTGWHIRTGEWILANHAVPMRDIFSFSKPTGVWYAWEWLSEVLWAELNRFGGLRTVVFFSILLLSITFTLLFRLVRRKVNPVVAIAVTMLAAAASSIHWLARPHLFTLLFLVLFMFALENVRDGRATLGGIPYLAILPIATILWTNLHGGFIVGIIMVGGYGAGELLKMALTADDDARRPAWLMAQQYLFCSFACLAASFINPYTYRLHLHVFEYLRDPYQSQHIVEFLSLSFHHPVAIFFESLLLSSAATAIWNARRDRYTEGVLLMVWAHGALLSARNIPIFAIAAAPPVAAAIDSWLQLIPQRDLAGWIRNAAARFNRVTTETAQTDSIPRWHVISVLGALLVAALIYAPNPPKSFRSEFDPKVYPAAALPVLLRDPSAHIFTNDEWGDYLIYRLYPRTKVFVDGRSDFYGADFEEKYLDVLGVKYGWEKTLRKFGVDTILMPASAPLSGALKESSRWHVVYDDGISLVFRSAQKSAGQPLSIAADGVGTGRDREVTKTQVRDHSVTGDKPKT
jgi:hypothetical protein